MTINQAFTILADAGGVRAARIITENNPVLSGFRVWKMARMLRRGVPVAKIIGQKWFWGLSFYTNKYTLDPRPDTETLVAAVIADALSTAESPNILDLGTGTGCIIISLVKNISGGRGVAVDISRAALRVAYKNVCKHNVCEKVVLKRGSFYKPNAKFDDGFDIVVSNPPYIARGDRRVNLGATYDPELALYAPDDGYAAYVAIAKNAKAWLRDGGRLYLEIGVGMGGRIRKIFKGSGWHFVRSENDLAGVERVLVFAK